jgi:hypothetical protein
MYRFIDLIDHGDQLMADRGFLVKEEIMIKRATLIITPAAQGAKAYASPGTYSYHNLCSVVFLVVRQCSRYPVFTGRSARPCPSDALPFFPICSDIDIWVK